MSYVAFSGGSSELSKEETEKVTLLAKALEQRPSLLLEIRGSYHADHDGKAIQEARLNEKLALYGSASSQPGQQEWEQAMEAMFQDQFGEDELAALRKGFERPMESDRSDAREKKRPTAKKERDSGATQFDQAGYHEGLRQRLVEAQPLEKGELRQLAMDRAMAVKDHLVQTGLVDEARIFILEAEPIETTESKKVRTELSLTGV
jgi:outer membrane protein OmpA-like peptidoglycan-associated protein